MRTFRTQALRILRQKFPGIEAVPDKKDSALIKIEDGTRDLTIDLANIHAAVRYLPAALKQAALGDFLEEMAASGCPQSPGETPWTKAKELLRPRLVSPDMRVTVPDVLVRRFAPGAVVAYVLDQGRRVQYVIRDHLVSWGVDTRRIHEVAVANLEALSEALPLELREGKGGGLLTLVAMGDSYDAARLVLPRFRERLMAELGEPIFVGIPDRDTFVAWSSDHAQLAKLVALIGKYAAEEPYPITGTIFRVDRKGVRVAIAERRHQR